ncbi:MAG: TetR/AcrR family transcriptional regulator [Polyangiaceae bacterium]
MTSPLLKSRVELAPPRGRYDRTLDEAARDHAQTARVIQATAEQLAARGPAELTVEHVIIHAGISRATFYQHFSDLDAAVASVVDALEEKVVGGCASALRQEPAPRGQLQAMATAFLVEVENHPHLTLAGALVLDPQRAESALRRLLRPLLQRWLDDARRAGLAAPTATPLVGGWLAALFEVTALDLVLRGGALGELAERLARGASGLVR